MYVSLLIIGVYILQILTLLECMGLKKHQEAFMEERVNGEILMECDETVLQEELKVIF